MNVIDSAINVAIAAAILGWFAQRIRPAEGAAAMVYYDRPGPFTPDVEERIVREVRRLVR